MREFAPYHQIVFDDVVPGDMRISDIVTVLKTAQFDVKSKPVGLENIDETDTPKWLVRANRDKDSLSLTVAVDGKRLEVEESVLEQGRMVRRTKETGWIKLSVRGVLPRDHQELTRQMNELQAALRERYHLHRDR
jgi:hypothetical protein